ATIYELSELVASGATTSEVVHYAERALVPLLQLRRCLFVSGPSDETVSRIEPDGSVYIGSLRWDVHALGLPGTSLELPVVTQGREVGRFVLQPTPGVPVSIERRVVAVALADQVGAA